MVGARAGEKQPQPHCTAAHKAGVSSVRSLQPLILVCTSFLQQLGTHIPSDTTTDRPVPSKMGSTPLMELEIAFSIPLLHSLFGFFLYKYAYINKTCILYTVIIPYLMHVSGQWCQYSKTFPPAHREGDSAARSWGRVKEQGPCPLGHHLCPSVTSSSLSTGPGSLTARGTFGTRFLTPTPPQT